jgi:DNA-directed RNA polymerase specialized sigma24 family protein
MKTQKQQTLPIEIITIGEDSVKLSEDKNVLEELLERLDLFINAEVEKRSNGLVPQEQDEIKQNVRIKLWRALQVRIIQYPLAYVRTIIKNEFNDLGRGRKFPEQLLLDDYGEVKQGQILANLSEGWGNPEHVVEQNEDVANLLNVAVEAISVLPRRQQLAIVCSLLERVDNVIYLKKVFEKYQVQVEMEDWPNDEMDVQRLKALISVARPKIVEFMSNNVAVSRRGVSNTPLRSYANVIKRRRKQETKVL